jgi:hypothetical protein
VVSTLSRSISFSPTGTKVIQPTLGVAAAMKAKSDYSFQPKVQIFDEFALKDGVAVVSRIDLLRITPNKLIST